MTGNGRLTGRQERALWALLSEPSIAAAAQAAGIGERTLHRWLDDPGFQDAYYDARRQAVGQAVARLQRAACTAVDTLEAVMADLTAPAAARVSAAKVVLEQVRAESLEDQEQRITELEALVATIQQKGASR